VQTVPRTFSIYDIRLYRKSPDTKNYMELWGAVDPSASPGSAIGRAHTSAKAANVAQLSGCQVTHHLMRSIAHPSPPNQNPNPNPNPNRTINVTLTSRDPDYHKHPTVSSTAHVSPFHRIL